MLVKKSLRSFWTKVGQTLLVSLVLSNEVFSAPIEPASELTSLRINLELKDSVSLARDQLFLDDVLSCESPSPGECQTVLETRIPKDISAGEKFKITKDDILAALSDLKLQIQFKNTQAVAVEIKSMEVHEDQVLNFLESRIGQHTSGLENLKIRINGLRILGSIKLIPGVLEMDVPEYLDHPTLDNLALQRIVGSKYFDLVLKSSQQAHPRSARVMIDSSVHLNLPVAKSNLARGKHLNLSDFRYAWVELDPLQTSPITDLTAIKGKVARRILRAGQAIYEENLENIGFVKRGQMVEAEMRKGEMAVKTKMRALGQGAAGEAITVQHLLTRKTFEGVVLGPGRVGVSL